MRVVRMMYLQSSDAPAFVPNLGRPEFSRRLRRHARGDARGLQSADAPDPFLEPFGRHLRECPADAHFGSGGLAPRVEVVHSPATPL